MEGRRVGGDANRFTCCGGGLYYEYAALDRDLAQKIFDLFAQAGRCGLDRLRRRQHSARGAARAASIVALSASRLVCPAIVRMSLTTSPISCVERERPAILSLATWASFTAIWTSSAVRTSWRLISAIDVNSSSAAAAAAPTLT